MWGCVATISIPYLGVVAMGLGLLGDVSDLRLGRGTFCGGLVARVSIFLGRLVCVDPWFLSHGGNGFAMPGFLGDSGSTGSGEFGHRGSPCS